MTKLTGVELAQRTLAHIEDLERRKAAGEKLCQHWDQSDWGHHIDEGVAGADICGTAMCFAGWACHLAGEAMVLRPTRMSGYGRWFILGEDGRSVSISDRAAELLELPETVWGEPDTRLFDGSLELADLRYFVDQLADGTYGEESP